MSLDPPFHEHILRMHTEVSVGHEYRNSSSTHARHSCFLTNAPFRRALDGASPKHYSETKGYVLMGQNILVTPEGSFSFPSLNEAPLITPSSLLATCFLTWLPADIKVLRFHYDGTVYETVWKHEQKS